ncbi:MAG: DUF6036 family nucleotidyltransferase [Methanosarcinales archaeon]
MITKIAKLFKSLNDAEVKYLLIGGLAAIAYGVPRTTQDFDIAIEPTLENVEKLLKALKKIGLESVEWTYPKEILEYSYTTFANDLVLDVWVKPKCFEFKSSWNNRNIIIFEGVKVYVVSLDDLIKMKKCLDRKTDLFDITLLEKAKNI